jgi:hypothetical protein
MWHGLNAGPDERVTTCSSCSADEAAAACRRLRLFGARAACCLRCPGAAAPTRRRLILDGDVGAQLGTPPRSPGAERDSSPACLWCAKMVLRPKGQNGPENGPILRRPDGPAGSRAPSSTSRQPYSTSSLPYSHFNDRRPGDNSGARRRGPMPANRARPIGRDGTSDSD